MSELTTPNDPHLYGIDELANRAGVSRRTVRFYVQRGLLHAPRGLGRGRHYTEQHLQRLIRIRTLQEQGVALGAIAALVAADAESAASMQTSTRQATSGAQAEQHKDATAEVTAGVLASLWTHLELDDNVVLQVRGRVVSEETRHALRKAVMTLLER